MSAAFIHKFVPGRLGVTVLLLHGTGGDEDDLLPVGRGLAPGAALLSPRGKVLEHGIFDEVEIRQRAGELAARVGAAVQQYGIDALRLYALGYSSGANIAAATLLLHPGTIAGALLLRPTVVIRPDPLPKLDGPPVLISAGQHDETVPPGGAEELGKMLSNAGAHVDIAIQNAGHDLTPADFNLGKQWFARLLAG